MAATGHNYMKIDNVRRERFLSALECSYGNFSAACRAASPHSKATNGKPCYSSFRRLMNVSPEFSQDVAETMSRVRDKVAEEITNRAIDGIETPVFQKGTRATDHDGSPASITSHDNKLLLRLAAKLDPENWGVETQKHDHRITVHSTGRALCQFGMKDLEYLDLEQKAQLTRIMVVIQNGREKGGVVIDGGEVEMIAFDDQGAEDGQTVEEAIPY